MSRLLKLIVTIVAVCGALAGTAQASEKAEAVARFHREVKAAAQLSHPNIVTSHDADQSDDQIALASSDAGTPREAAPASPRKRMRFRVTED